MAAIAVYAADAALRRRLEGYVAEAEPDGAISIAASPAALLDLLKETGADIVLAGVSGADGESVDWTAVAHHAALVMVLDDAESMLEALEAGASATVPAAAGADGIAAALRAVALGLKLLPPDVLNLLLGERRLASGESDEPGGGRLTPRELEVLAALADGASNKAIARRLNISFHTVKFHVASILAKLDAESRTEAVTQAARLGLVML
jgi:NarL family two-component system response regulator YdfI